MIVLEIIAAVLIVLGAAFVLLAAVGVIRLPDLLSRIHAASKAGSVGATLILLAIAMISFNLFHPGRCLAFKQRNKSVTGHSSDIEGGMQENK